MARGNLFPILLATVFGVVNGIVGPGSYITSAYSGGANVGLVGYENKAEEEISLYNQLARMNVAADKKKEEGGKKE
ncbi:Protein of unknown function [Pyronema omphalodes CBS 100304]|uniref:Uncharacterized protein n=1 Tax=Pyronema omphalodes (strain CBS 100304) TaxID=1076935 RepID=U4LIU1_PYROM|nr:Protein of unknown function [Pyronema omphalodes CBS 100304]